MILLKQTEEFEIWRAGISDGRVRAAVAARLTRLLRGLAGDVKPVGGGISELRIHFGPGYRIYFQRRKNTVILLLCGGDKGTQTKDINIAKRLAEKWSDDND